MLASTLGERVASAVVDEDEGLGKISSAEVVEPDGKERYLMSDGGKRRSCFGVGVGCEETWKRILAITS